MLSAAPAGDLASVVQVRPPSRVACTCTDPLQPPELTARQARSALIAVANTDRAGMVTPVDAGAAPVEVLDRVDDGPSRAADGPGADAPEVAGGLATACECWWTATNAPTSANTSTPIATVGTASFMRPSPTSR